MGLEPTGTVVAAERRMAHASMASQGGDVRMGLEDNVVVEPSGARVFHVPQRQLC